MIVRTEAQIRHLLMDHIVSIGVDEEKADVLTQMAPAISSEIVGTLAMPKRQTTQAPDDDDEMVYDLLDAVVEDLDTRVPFVYLHTANMKAFSVDYFKDLCEAHDFASVVAGKTIGEMSLLIEAMNKDRTGAEKSIIPTGNDYYSAMITSAHLGIRFTLHALNYRMTFAVKSALVPAA